MDRIGGWSLRLRVAVLALAGWTLPASADEFTFAVEPSYPPDQAQEVYSALIDYLNRTTGHTFKLVVPRNYHFYWRDIRQGKQVDFAYEEAHFVDYRVQRFGYVPLVRREAPSVYALIADFEFGEKGLVGLVGRRIVSMPAPSMGFALLAELYDNPVSQPDFRSEASSWRDGVEMVFSGDAEAAMVPSFIAEQYPNLAEVAASREFPGAALVASPEVDAAVRELVRDALLKLHEDADSYNTLVELGAQRLVEADAAEYRGAERMLSGFFGYIPPSAGAADEDED